MGPGKIPSYDKERYRFALQTRSIRESRFDCIMSRLILVGKE
jgi:hypothetical protein